MFYGKAREKVKRWFSVTVCEVRVNSDSFLANIVVLLYNQGKQFATDVLEN